ncbi:hypothetical protein [Spiroplasma endosymbiont of Amphibalanus improvisus]|uniref:hypothetical protein n=1 Tax=Spiroplasma endosymbiont of Amphibalanus improvisus TaxID=3066327 RepID=UPI00313F1830
MLVILISVILSITLQLTLKSNSRKVEKIYLPNNVFSSLYDNDVLSYHTGEE